ncbi:MAG TPA: hypothetical protein VFX49_09190, partial [Chloroflexota bacterium]|nr:hypothetical protein [Chloroflexota bacterium]
MPTAAAAEDVELRVPPPLAEPPHPFLSVGKHGPASVDAEDFARRLGNWGNASRLIGERWEATAPARLRQRLPWRTSLGGGHTATITALLALDADRAIGPMLQRAGVSAPDLLLVGTTGGRAVLRAADCKVSLDTADREQTAPARLQQMFLRASTDLAAVGQGLLSQAGDLAEGDRAAAHDAVAGALAGDWQRVLVGEGLFVAPDNGFNRWFLARLEERRRTGAPLGRMPAAGPRRAVPDVKGPVDAAQALRLQLPAHLEPVSARDFLAGVPGWEEGEIVAQLDKLNLATCDLAVAERCWRVGAGLRGAVLALKRRLFRNALAIETAAVDTRAILGELSRRRRASDSAALIAS